MATDAGSARPNPFPGLRPFEPDEVHLFFGREAQIDELLGRLRRNRFVGVVGASGSGKSSLVRSGLIPSLHSGFMASAGSSWRIALMRPGGAPLRNLAAALERDDVLGGADRDDMRRALLDATLRRSARGLVQAVQQARIAADVNILIIVDQFEELFRFKDVRATIEARDEAVAFVKLLLTAVTQTSVPIYVVLTMRSEFIGHCTEFPGLAETVNDGQYLVPRMTRDEVRLAITGPVAVGGGQIAGRLVTRLLNDMGDDPDQLPILQHALMRTWHHWVGRRGTGPIDIEDYDAIGTMREALSRHAEEAYGELDSDAARRTAERLFKALTEVTGQGIGIRRPCCVKDLAVICGVPQETIVRVIDRFRSAGRSFLSPSGDVPIDGETIVDLSHESLMRGWPRLIDWTGAEAQAVQMYRRLSQSADLHERGEASLWRDPELQLAINWREATEPTVAWSRRYDAHFDRAMSFLAESERSRDEAIERAERLRQGELQRARRVALGFAALSIAALFVLVFALFQRNSATRAEGVARQQAARAEEARQIAERETASARREKDRAEQQRDIATRANQAARESEQRATIAAKIATQKEDEARQNAEIARRNAEQGERSAAEARKNAAEARVNAAEAQRNAEDATRRQSEARAAQLAAEQARQDEKTARDLADRLARLSLARALAGQALREWDTGDLQIPALLARQAFLFTRENGGDENDPDVYSALATSLGRLKRDLTQSFAGHTDAVRALVLDAAQSTLVTGADDGSVRIFDLAQPVRPRSVLAGASGVRSLAASAGSIAAGYLDGSLRLWNTANRDGRAPLTLNAAHAGAVSGIGLAGDILLTAGSDGAVKAWSIKSPAVPNVLLPAQPARMLALATNAAASRAAAAGEGSTVLIWDLRKLSEPTTLGGVQHISALTFSADGRYLAAGTQDGRIVVWDLAKQPAELLRGTVSQHTAAVTGLSFGANVLASSSLDGTVKLWPIVKGVIHLDQQPIARHDHKGWVWAVALAGNADRVFSAGADRTVRSAPTQTQRLADAVCTVVANDLTASQWKEYVSETEPYVGTCGSRTAAGRQR
jgi:WD40 repeat protein/energy-coupling factor transporter ATP-binding protein EcfA2